MITYETTIHKSKMKLTPEMKGNSINCQCSVNHDINICNRIWPHIGYGYLFSILSDHNFMVSTVQ